MNCRSKGAPAPRLQRGHPNFSCLYSALSLDLPTGAVWVHAPGSSSRLASKLTIRFDSCWWNDEKCLLFFFFYMVHCNEIPVYFCFIAVSWTKRRPARGQSWINRSSKSINVCFIARLSSSWTCDDTVMMVFIIIFINCTTIFITNSDLLATVLDWDGGRELLNRSVKNGLGAGD